MTRPWLDDGDVRIHVGDALAARRLQQLSLLADGSAA